MAAGEGTAGPDARRVDLEGAEEPVDVVRHPGIDGAGDEAIARRSEDGVVVVAEEEVRHLPGYRPVNFGSRFSRNAAMPSARSEDVVARDWN